MSTSQSRSKPRPVLFPAYIAQSEGHSPESIAALNQPGYGAPDANLHNNGTSANYPAMITQSEEPRKRVSSLHQQAIDIVTSSTGNLAELEELEALFHQASGEEEAKLIDVEMERWVVTHSNALLKAHDLSLLDI